jgi:hypothetical protein
MAYSPADKTFGSFSGVAMTVEGVSIQEKKQEPPKEAPKPQETAKSPPPSTADTKSKSKTQQLEEYEKDYMQRLEQEGIEQQKAAEAKPEPEKPKSSKGTLPKCF